MTTRAILAAIIFIGGLSAATADTFTFANTNAVVINDSISPPTSASPYPSTNLVSGVAGSRVSKVTVQIFGFAHTFSSDVDIVLVGPRGQNAVLMGNIGSLNLPSQATNINLTLDDDAASSMPLDSDLVSGTFKPTQRNAFPFDFPAPAPATSNLMGPALANFKNIDPNGAWSLYVVDDNSSDSGIISGGWSLTFTAAPSLAISQTGTYAILSWADTITGYSLQATPSLSPAAWTNVSPAPVVIFGHYTVTNAMTNTSTFYRLAK
jgi:hypothetical protein